MYLIDNIKFYLIIYFFILYKSIIMWKTNKNIKISVKTMETIMKRQFDENCEQCRLKNKKLLDGLGEIYEIDNDLDYSKILDIFNDAMMYYA